MPADRRPRPDVRTRPGRARERRLRAALVARLRREVTATAVQAGVRAAVATAAPIALAYALGVPALVVAGVGGWLTSMADVGGATGARVRAMGAYLVLGPMAYAAGALAAPFPAAVVAALAALFAGAGGLLRAGGDAGATLGVLFGATFAAALGVPGVRAVPPAVGAGLLALGGLWAMLLALVAWPVRPYDAARRAAAGCYRELAAFARGAGEALDTSVADAGGGLVEQAGAASRAAVRATAAPRGRLFTRLARETHPRVRAAIEAARGVLVVTRRGRAGGSRRADDVAVLVDGADALFLTLLTAVEAVETVAAHAAVVPASACRDATLPGDARTLAHALAQLGTVLDGVADAIIAADRRAGDRLPALEGLARTAVALVESSDPDGSPDDTKGDTPSGGRWVDAGRDALRHAAALLEHAAGEAEWAGDTAAALAAGVDPPPVAGNSEPTGEADGRSGNRGIRARLGTRLHHGWRGMVVAARSVVANTDASTVRHALRLGVTVAAAQLLGAALHAERGPWITVTALLVLQPSAGLTVRRSAARVGGTVAGGVVAAALAATLRDPRLVAGGVFVLAGLAVAARGVHYGVFTFFLTPVFVLLAQPAPGDWALAGVRVADTLLGATVAVLAGVLLWPTWERASLPVTVAEVVEAARAHLALAVRAATAGPADGSAPEALARARRQAGLAAMAGEGALERLLAEPGRRRGAALLALLARVRRLNGAAAALAAFGPAPHAVGAERLVALGAEVNELLAGVAAAVRMGRAPAAVPGVLAGLLDEPRAGAGRGEVWRTAERRLPNVPAWGTLVRVARHAVGVREAAGRLFGGGGSVPDG